jgi:predicted acyltransferase
MGGIPQLLSLVPAAVAILAGLLLVAFLVGRCFRDKKTRKRIMIGAIGAYLLALLAYFGWIAFILSGNLNSN